MSSIAINHAAPAAPVNTSTTNAQVFALASNPVLPCTVAAPGKLAVEAKRFSLRAEGTAIVAVAAYTVKPTLLAALSIPASPLTAANWTTIAAGAAVAISTTTLAAPWWIHADLILDSISGLLQGNWQQLVNNAWTAPAALGAQLSGINSTNSYANQAGTNVPPSDPVVQFAVALTFGTAGANIGNLVNFEIGF